MEPQRSTAPDAASAPARDVGAADRPAGWRFSTDGFAPRERFDAFRAAYAGVFDFEPPTDGGGTPADFRAEVRTWAVGPFALRGVRHGRARCVRDARRARRDGLDHWVVSVFRHGLSRGAAGERCYEVVPGQPFFAGMHEPLVAEREDSDIVTLFVPRDALPELGPRLDARLGSTSGAPLARLLAAHLSALERHAADMTPADAARAADATAALLRAAVAGADAPDAPARSAVAATERARLAAMIRQHMGSARLGPGRLARLAGISRARLYEVFAPDGGVARAIQRERLRAVCRALAMPSPGRGGIAAVAEAHGFADPSVFGRAFRREFGMTPGEWREAAAAGAAPVPPTPPPADDFARLLLRLAR